MKWTDAMLHKNENPWDNNPWGKSQKPQNGKPQQQNDELEAFIRKSQEALKKMMSNGGGGGQGGKGKGPNVTNLALLGLGAVFVLWLLTGFYIIEEGSRGVVLRFGEYVRTTSPGPHYRLPSPLERVEKVSVDRIRTEEIGYRSNAVFRGRNTGEQSIAEESLMLTGDENIVDVRMDVQWIVKDARDYVFNVRDSVAQNTVKSAAESAIRDVIGETNYTTAIAGEGRAQIAAQTQTILQDILDDYRMGVQVNSVQMRPIDPPEQVIDAFRDVQTARADKEREINQAEAYSNDILPRAKGDAEKILQDAQAYKQEVIARAEGEADRFVAIYEQYRTAKTVTKQRMYLEAMEDVLTGMEKIIIDSSAQGSGVLPYLPLSELKKKSQ